MVYLNFYVECDSATEEEKQKLEHLLKDIVRSKNNKVFIEDLVPFSKNME